MGLKFFFTWWHKQTFGTFLKTLFFGRYVGSDEYGNKYYKNKNDERWVVYSGEIEATKITSDWFLWMHHTIDKVPNKNNKHAWQKKHQENNFFEGSKIGSLDLLGTCDPRIRIIRKISYRTVGSKPKLVRF